jgi:hypothetical protein
MHAIIGVEATLADHGAACSSAPDRQDRGEKEWSPLSLNRSLVWCDRTSKWLVTSQHAVTHPL